MFKNIKFFHNKNLIRAKVRNSLNEDIQEINKKYALNEDIIDENLIKEDIDVIKLYYDKYSKWITLHNASVLWFLALTLAYWGKSIWLNILLVFVLIFSLIWAYQTNIRMNILFNTLLRKTKDNLKSKINNNDK